MKLQQLVYVSTATVPIGSVMEVSDILEESVRNNRANNITGALAFTDTGSSSCSRARLGRWMCCC